MLWHARDIWINKFNENGFCQVLPYFFLQMSLMLFDEPLQLFFGLELVFNFTKVFHIIYIALFNTWLDTPLKEKNLL